MPDAVRAGFYPATGFRKMAGQRTLHLENQQSAGRAKNEKVALTLNAPTVDEVVAPDDRPRMARISKPPQQFRHPDFGLVASMRRAMENPFNHENSAIFSSSGLTGSPEFRGEESIVYSSEIQTCAHRHVTRKIERN
jgi:hypothetical protein